MSQWYGLSIFIGIIFAYVINFLYFRHKNSHIDLNSLVIPIYLGAFIGGKFTYIFFDASYLFAIDKFYLSIDLLCGGFSLLGASLCGEISLLYYINKKKINNTLNAFLPISLLCLHGFGRIGCFLSDCCGGIFYNYNLHYISILFYFIAAACGLILFFLNYLSNFYIGLCYYSFIIFLERFLFDIYRYDGIFLNNGFTKYQLFSLLYLLISFLFIFCFFKKKIHKK